MNHTGILIAIAILPALWLAPLALLFPVVYFEITRGGPRLRVHVPLNVAFLAWSIYAVQFLNGGLHSTNSPLIMIPRLLVLALFYALAVPKLVEDSARRRVFRYVIAGSDAFAFAVLCVTAGWIEA